MPCSTSAARCGDGRRRSRGAAQRARSEARTGAGRRARASDRRGAPRRAASRVGSRTGTHCRCRSSTPPTRIGHSSRRSHNGDPLRVPAEEPLEKRVVVGRERRPRSSARHRLRPLRIERRDEHGDVVIGPMVRRDDRSGLEAQMLEPEHERPKPEPRRRPSFPLRPGAEPTSSSHRGWRTARRGRRVPRVRVPRRRAACGRPGRRRRAAGAGRGGTTRWRRTRARSACRDPRLK